MIDIPILYEDNHLLVVEKPTNMPVQQDQSLDRDLLNHLKEFIKVRDKKPGNVFLALIHRLDRPVGGVMVFGKTSKAASRLSDAIRRGKFYRKYLAVVRGIPAHKEGKLVDYLWKDRKQNKVFTVPKHHKRGKKAILDYQVIQESHEKQLTLLSVQLYTGRSHQIRIQLKELGHPLFGDQKYGKNDNKPGEQIALWAHSLEFPHTTSKKLNKFHSKPPNEFPWNLFNPKSINEE